MLFPEYGLSDFLRQRIYLTTCNQRMARPAAAKVETWIRSLLSDWPLVPGQLDQISVGSDQLYAAQLNNRMDPFQERSNCYDADGL